MTQTVEESVGQLPAPGKFLIFRLQQDLFGIAVLKVREIMRMCPITVVPRTSEHIKGVINLRGKIVPVIDLRSRFDMPALLDTERVCIIVVQYRNANAVLNLVGMVVDVVDEVATFTESNIKPAPDFGAALDTRFINGMAESNGRVKTLLDIDKLLSTEGGLSLNVPARQSLAAL